MALLRAATLLTLFSVMTGALFEAVGAGTNGKHDIQILVPQVTFMATLPIIDGALDANLRALPVRRFSHLRKSADDTAVTPAEYRLAYGTGFFYVYIRADADELVFREPVITVMQPDED